MIQAQVWRRGGVSRPTPRPTPRPPPLSDAAIDPRRWWVLAVVVAAQFMFVVDAFVVNVAIPSIRADLAMTEAGIEAVIVLYQLAFATLVIAGGRLGDLRGRETIFLLGVIGFTAASVWCGCASSGTELIVARIAQGGAGALMSPQVLAAIHTLFPDEARARAFSVFGVALGLGAAAGYLLGGGLLALNPFGLGWRALFFVNGPAGLAIALAGWRLLPRFPARAGQRMDLPGAALLFLGLLAVLAPVLGGRELRWPLWLGLVEAAGLATLALFVTWERRAAEPLIDLALLTDGAFARGLLCAVCFFCANMSFYLVLTLFLQNGMGLSPLGAGLIAAPMSVGFVIGSRLGGGIVRGCFVQIAGLAAIGGTIALVSPLPPAALIPALLLFGYGQGRVMAPLFGVILGGVRHANAGAGAGILTTVQQAANATGVALIGLIYFAVHDAVSSEAAILTALAVLSLLVFGTAVSLRRMAQVRVQPP